MTRSYADAAAFRQALETRIRGVAQERGVQIQGLRLKVAIERLLARLFHGSNPPWLLKGGYAMELRFRPNARTTRDLDLTLREPLTQDEGALRLNAAVMRLHAVHEALLDAAGRDLGDFFQFRIPPVRQELAAVPGAVFSIVAQVAGRDFARFHIDMGFDDAVISGPEPLVGEDLLAFAEIPPPIVLAIPREQQFAEKMHAYTFPWTGRENTRSRDIVDLLLLIERGHLELDAVRHAVRMTFAHREKQPIPSELVPPPSFWAIEFPPMAREAGLATTDVAEAFAVLAAFWRRLAFDGVAENGPADGVSR